MIPLETRTRPARFADDMWYSADATLLTERLQTYLADPPLEIEPGKLVGLVAPHAGHRFSGHVAGAAFASLTPNAFETVVLLGPDHRGAAPAHLSTPNVDAWATPLGAIPVARDIVNTLHEMLDLVLLATDNEHSLEVELPFLQHTLGQFRLVPAMMGSQSLDTCRALSTALPAACPPGTLFVASSDLSHFFDDTNARRLDEETLAFILDMDAPGLIEHVEAGRRAGKPLACGAGPIAAVMLTAAALGASQAQLIKYATSADVHPNRSRVVGYSAVAFTR